MTRLEQLEAEVEGNRLMWAVLDQVAQDRSKERAMEQCAHCGINLAKVDPMEVLDVVTFDGEGDTRRVVATRHFCSPQCRDWALMKDARRRPER